MSATLNAISRFVDIRGMPHSILSDNFSTFVSKDKDLENWVRTIQLDDLISTTTSYHPQCNSQAEVCNKTIAKYLAAFVDGLVEPERPLIALGFIIKQPNGSIANLLDHAFVGFAGDCDNRIFKPD